MASNDVKVITNGSGTITINPTLISESGTGGVLSLEGDTSAIVLNVSPVPGQERLPVKR